MAIYHLSIKIIGRSQGRSSVAAAAYRAADKITNEYDGVTHDFRRKGWVEYSEIMLPDNAPDAFRDRSTLWNSVEQSEKSKTAQLSREIEVALPKELTLEQQIELVRQYVQEEFVSKGMCADWSIHNPPMRDDKNRPIDENGNLLKDSKDYIYPNPHAHIMTTMRPLDENGNWMPKTQTEYLCVRDGIEAAFTAEEYKLKKDDGWEKQYQYMDGKKKVWLTADEGTQKGLQRVNRSPRQSRYGRQNEQVEQWNSNEQIHKWRVGWELYCNTYMMDHGIQASISSESNQTLGKEELPTVHIGVEANSIEKRADRLEAEGKKAPRSEAGAINREIKRYNSLIGKIRDTAKKVAKGIGKKLVELHGVLVGAEYHLLDAQGRLTPEKRSRYRTLSGYVTEYDKYQAQIDSLKEEQKRIAEEAKQTGLLDMSKRRDQKQAAKETQERLDAAISLQKGLSARYGTEGQSITGIRKELNRLSYVGKFENMEAVSKRQKDETLREYRKEYKTMQSNLTPSVIDDIKENQVKADDSMRETLKKEYAGEYSEETFQKALVTVDRETEQIGNPAEKQQSRAEVILT